MARRITTMRCSAPWPQLERLLRSFCSAATAWVFVLTVLFCAVMPAGLPHTTSQGSAFNPATTSVALRANGPERFVVKQGIARDPAERWHDPPVMLFSGFAVATGPLPILPVLVQPGGTEVEASVLHAQALARLRHAREPPIV